MIVAVIRLTRTSNLRNGKHLPMVEKELMPVISWKTRLWRVSLLLAIFAVSILSAYHLGQRSQRPYIAGMAEQVENWKMIYKAESAKQSVVMAFRDNMSIAEFENKFCAAQPVSGVGVSGELRELIGSDDKHTHVFTDKRTGRVFRLRFENEKLVGYHSGYGLGEAANAVAANNRK